MIPRSAAAELLASSEAYPVVTVVGPRQSGKTTLVRNLFGTHHYCNLEQPEIRRLAMSDPKSFFRQYKPPIILDEIQRVPELLSWIQVMVDENETCGQFILTGSHQGSLREGISQSLAGRTGVVTLLPFTIGELAVAGFTYPKEAQIFRGFLPRVYSKSLNPYRTYRDYFQTYVERDLRQIANVKDLRSFETFMSLLAGRIGSLLNLSSLGNEVGVTGTTCKEWLSILEASHIVYLLKPYYRNIGKRLVKAPKVYFIETGLAASLLGIETEDQVFRDPLAGNLFENMVIMEALKCLYNAGKNPALTFFRDSNGNEVDLVLEKQREPVPVEIKSAETWSSHFTKSIEYFRKLVPTSRSGFVIYSGDIFPKSEDSQAIHFSKTEELIR